MAGPGRCLGPAIYFVGPQRARRRASSTSKFAEALDRAAGRAAVRPLAVDRSVSASGYGYPPPHPGSRFWQCCAPRHPRRHRARSQAALLAYFLLFQRALAALSRSAAGEQPQPRAAPDEPEARRQPASRSSRRKHEAPTPAGSNGCASQATSRRSRSHRSGTAATDADVTTSCVILINSSMIALNQANATGNYTVLARAGGAGLSGSEQPGAPRGDLQPLRAGSSICRRSLSVQPKLFRAPEMNSQGMIRLAGSSHRAGARELRPNLPAGAG